jgi:hypothetical protein
MTVPINHAFYVKLGVGGCWEDDSLANACIRVGFPHQNVADINAGNWAKIKKQLDAGKKQSVATADLNRLRELTASVRGDVWVTFHEGRMWWTRVVPGPVRQDKLSKYRKTQPWRDRDEQGKLLVSTGLPGKIASVQAYRRTICSIEDRALLRRVLEGTRGEVAIPMPSAISTASSPIGALNCAGRTPPRWWPIWKTGCAPSAPSSRVTTTSPRRLTTC